MYKQPIYVKFNSYRKPEFNLTTEIWGEKGKYFVYKIAQNKKARNFVQDIYDTYIRLSELDLPFKVNKCHFIDEDTLKFDYIQGKTLLKNLERTVKINNRKKFKKVLNDFESLLNRLPSKRGKLDKDFCSFFECPKGDAEYDLISTGLLDLTLDNIIKNNKDEMFLIDYEWSFDFSIPREYLLFRAIFNSFVSLKPIMSDNFDFDSITSNYGIDRKKLEKYFEWERNFQLYVSGVKPEKIDLTIKKDTNQSEQLKQETIVTSKFENEQIINALTEEKEKLKRENINLTPDAQEFRELKKTKLWKSLIVYRKIKKYLKHFFINIYRDGFSQTFKRIFKRIDNYLERKKQKRIDENRYKYWLKNNTLTKVKRINIKKEIESLDYKPLISIIMPVYNVDVKWIKKAIKSIQNQLYTNWEICIADDASTDAKLIEYLKKISKDSKIKVTFRKRNGHISEASNSALELAKGEFIALLDNDDIIYPHTLAEVVKLLNKKPDIDFIYSDEDKLNMKGERMDPFFKPDWSPDLFLATNYLCHLSLIRKKLIDSVGGFRKGYEGSQDYDLFLRITEKTNHIEHIPNILYSWRKIPGSTASDYNQKGYATKTSIKALEDSLKRRGLEGEVAEGLFPGSFRVKYKLRGEPLVSILIPTKDKREYIERCISSILNKTTYTNFEIIILDTGSTKKETLDYLDTIKENQKVRVLHWEKKFNYSAVNNYGVRYSNGEYVLLLNNDTEIITPDWIEGMLEHAQRDRIGAVGVKLYYPNDVIQHAGVVLGINGGKGIGIAGHAFKGLKKDIRGFPIQKDIIRNYSAVTAACLMVKKEKYLEVNGLDEKYRIAFNDVDFCLKLREKGYYNLYTPYVELYHHESISVGTPEAKTRDPKEFNRETQRMYDKWNDLLLRDPFYNKNLSLNSEDFAIKIIKNKEDKK